MTIPVQKPTSPVSTHEPLLLRHPVNPILTGTIDADTINLYYGAADTSIALATGSIRELLAWLDDHRSPRHGDGGFR